MVGVGRLAFLELQSWGWEMRTMIAVMCFESEKIGEKRRKGEKNKEKCSRR